MRQTLSKGMVAAAAATSILSLYGSQAFADTNANGVAADSPGVLSGNNVQAPVSVPVNACGNSANVAAGLNPSFGNSCATPSGKHRKPDAPRHAAPASHGSDQGHGSDHGYGSGHGGGSGHGYGSDRGYGSDHGGGSGHHGSGHHGGPGRHGGGSSTHGATHGSPGVGSGNNAEVPVDVPVNACGNTADAVALLNPSFGNKCGHHGGNGNGHGHGGGPGHGHGGGDGHGHGGGHGYGGGDDGGPKGYGDDGGPKGYGDDDTPPTKPPTTPPTKPPTTTPPTVPPTTVPPTTVPPTTGPPVTGPPVTTPPSTTPPGPGTRPELPRTGSEGLLAASAAGAGLLLGGAVLYRRGRAASRRW
ncbi:chaplin [Streptomyces sp. BV286]|uniref:chaplin n=1 Tax=Streptomyces sp. BV286 TaxID=2849672 RepID=UPI0020C682BA|nr:chaplin [Streptomyces sp. BV286]